MEAETAQNPSKNIDETLSIQHDWHLNLREPVSQFYLGIKKFEATKTEFFQVQITKLVDEYGFAVMPEEGSIKSSDFTDVSLDEHKNLHVTFQGRTTIFVGPTSEQNLRGLQSAPRSFDVSCTGSTFVAADSSGKLIIANSRTAETLTELTGHTMDIYRCMYFPSGLVVIGGGMDMAIRVWAVDKVPAQKTFVGHTKAVTGFGIIGVGREFLSCSNDGTVRFWSCKNAAPTETWGFEKGKCIDMAMSVDDSRFAVICENNFLSAIDLHGDKIRRDIQLPSVPTALCFSGDEGGKAVFVGFEDGHVAAYNVSDRRLIGEIVTKKGSVTCLKYYCNRLIASFTTGNVLAFPILSLPTSSSIISAEYELTGADCEPVYDMAIYQKNIYTCCRDGKIRTYKAQWSL